MITLPASYPLEQKLREVAKFLEDCRGTEPAEYFSSHAQVCRDAATALAEASQRIEALQAELKKHEDQAARGGKSGSAQADLPHRNAGDSSTPVPDARLLELWRSVQGPNAGLTGPLIRFAAKVREEH